MIQLHLKVKNLVNLETMEHSMAHHEETNFLIKLWYKLVGTQGNWCPHFPKRKYIWYNMSRCFESSLKNNQLKPISYWISRLKNHKLYGLQRMNTRWTSFIYFLTSKAGLLDLCVLHIRFFFTNFWDTVTCRIWSWDAGNPPWHEIQSTRYSLL